MAGRIKVIKIIEEKWIHTPFFSVPANSRSEVEVPDYSPNDADREWVKTQIGDVPARITWLDRMAEKDPELALAFALFQGQEPVRDYFGETVPVESLGRDHG